MELEEAINIYSELKEHKEIIGNIDTDFFFKFAEIVLQALKKSIPKKKIGNKIEELNVVENAEALEDIMNRQNYTITELVQFVLQELLEEDK